MQILILCLAATIAISTPLHVKNPCDEVFCKAGRECVVLEGKGECLCQIACPDHLKPVCGSDGESYDSHCKLHQEACMTDTHIRVNHKGYCKESYAKDKNFFKKSQKKKQLEKEIENILTNDIHKTEDYPYSMRQTPAVCYSPQRNALRFLIVEYWEESLKNQTWHVEGMTFRESLWGWFFTCDVNKNNYLSPEELLTCSKDVPFFARPGQDTDVTKALCIDAMVSDGDTNSDYRLDFTEFTQIMNPEYQPKMKKCFLEGKEFIDGEEVHVDCNHCICAVGKWVCASRDCSKVSKSQKRNHIDHFMSNDITDDIKPIQQFGLLGEDNLAKKYFAEKSPPKSIKAETFPDYDYSDNLFEKTKSKNSKKEKYQLEKALKEIKLLKEKTEKLKKYWEDKIADSERQPKPYNGKKHKYAKKWNKRSKNKKTSFKAKNTFHTGGKY